MPEFLSFFIILLAGFFFSALGRRFHVPWTIALIVAGVVVGPHFLGIFEPDNTFTFLGQIGLVFLMFMAGLETNLSSLKAMKKEIITIAGSNGVVSFLVGVSVAIYFGYGLEAGMLLGIIFISSSISIVVPTLESRGMLNKPLGKIVVGTAVIRDLGSLFLLSLILQKADRLANISLPIFYLILAVTVLVLIKAIPKVRNLLIPKYSGYKDLFESEVRVTFIVLLGTVVVFGLLGLHPIVAGFFAGLVLSESVKSEIFKEKLHTITYGLFIPIFFIVVGSQTDITIFRSLDQALYLALAVALGSTFFNFVSGWLSAKIVGFGNNESGFIAGATIPQLSTTLAAAYAAQAVGLIDGPMVAAIVFLSVFSTFVGGAIISFYGQRFKTLPVDQNMVESEKSA